MPSSIQNPAFSCRVRTNSESAVSATRMTGVAQRHSSASSQRLTATIGVRTASPLAKAGGTYQRCRPARSRALFGVWVGPVHGRRLEALDCPLAVPGEDDVHGVVLAVGAGDSEEQRDPPPESQLALWCALALED